MFDKKRFDKLLELNKEYATATPERRKQIEQEIISMVPEELKPNTPEVTELTKLQSELKDQIGKLADCTTQADFHIFFKQLSDLDEKVCNYAKKLGVVFPRTDYETMKKKMIELRFKDENK